MASMANRITLNCDLGESFGAWKMGEDELIMPHIDMVNLACGFHAADPMTMDRSIKLAEENDLYIGAHPSYPDLMGFGRRSMKCSYEEIENIVLYQLGALDAFCKKHNSRFVYVKPHGALYNDMMNDTGILEAMLRAINAFDKSLMLMVLSSERNDELKKVASKYNGYLLFEAFLDRNYNDDGSLIPRDQENAVIHDADEVLKRIQELREHKYIKSINGKELKFKVDTLCVHGDNKEALEFIKKIRKIVD